MDEPGHITKLLSRATRGDREAEQEAARLVYDELHRLAGSRLRGGDRARLQTTELVNEVYLRMFRGQRVEWHNRAHFFNAAAQAIRRILVDHARTHHARKREGEREQVPLHEAMLLVQDRPAEFLTLERAIGELEVADPRLGRVVELRFFAGLTVEETAQMLEISPTTVKRDWIAARAWLLTQVRPDGSPWAG